MRFGMILAIIVLLIIADRQQSTGDSALRSAPPKAAVADVVKVNCVNGLQYPNGPLFYHSKRRVKAGVEAITIGATEYLFIRGKVVSCGFHDIQPESDGSYIATVGISRMRLGRDGTIVGSLGFAN